MIWPVPDEGLGKGVHIGGGQEFGEVEAATGDAFTCQTGDLVDSVTGRIFEEIKAI
jgi:hypothetical protein